MPDRYVEAFDASGSRFREIIERNADAILIVQQGGVVGYANPAAEAMFGRTATEMVGRYFSVPITGAETSEIDLPPLGGTHRTAEMRVVSTLWQGAPAHLASLRDITDRRRAEEALRFSGHASQALAGTLNYPDTIEQVGQLAVAHLADWCAIDLLDGDWVRRACVHRGSDQANGQNEPPHDAWLLDRQGGSALADVIGGGEPRLYCDMPEQVVAQAIAAPGRVAVLRELGCKSAMVLPLIARGRTIGAISYVSVDSPQRFGQGELTLAIDLAHRGALAIDNARMYEAAQTALRHRDQFLAMLAHELRNPLAAVFSAVELMRQSGDNQQILHRAEEVIERQGRHMARLLDELLDISRVTHGKIELRRSVVDLNELTRQAVDACRPLASSRQHQIVLDLPGEALWTHADATRLDQVLTNLLHNAAKYMGPGGTIQVEAARDAEGIVLRVSDQGAGISAADLPHIFDLFVQADRSLDRAQGGLGIGLTMVRHLVEMHGGSVAASSDGEGRGSQFTVRLPAAAEPAPRVIPLAAQPNRRPLRIVIVEDNVDARDMLQMLLTVEGHQVDIAEDGRQGLALIRRLQPQVALIDIGLPLMNGYELVRTLRAGDDSANLPMLVALTGYGQAEDRQRALAAGFDEHLIKPVDLDALCKLIAQTPVEVG